MSLSFFSHKIGIGKALGLQEYMVVVDYGKEDELEVWGYKSNFVQYLLTMMMILMSAGLLGLLLFNLKHWWLYFTQEACLLEEATTVLVVVSQYWIKFNRSCRHNCRITFEFVYMYKQ